MAAPLLALASLPTSAQDLIKKDQPAHTLNAEQRAELLDRALKQLNDHYIFPDKAREMEKAIRARQEKNEYDAITSPGTLAEILTKQLQEVSHDKHLRVMYSREPLPKHRETRPTPEERQRMRERMSKNNFGFEKVERLEGNVGYLDLHGFMDAEAAGETAAAAMSFLANTDALIIDLRKNGGGSPGMVALLCSYLFDGPPKHLNSLHWRRPEGEDVQQWWTLAYVPGQKYVSKDVYVLTSKRTFSAAEEFTYNLQTQKRATIVGETTGGGAHPGGTHPINDHFLIWVPSGRAVNPITKTNWEGSGVKPDLDVPADQALKTAHLAALKKSLAGRETDEFLKEQLKKLTDKLQQELNALKK
jgi:C-terminal processing protease CtpA/Prc